MKQTFTILTMSDYLIDELLAQVEELSSLLLNTETDLEHCKAFFSGDWTNSVQYLEKALERAKNKEKNKEKTININS